MMNSILRTAFDNEIDQARRFIAEGELNKAFAHLERAHIIGQAFVVLHARAHWWMLKVDILRERPFAVLGQIVRIVLGILGSTIGVVPVGNTGGSNVGMFTRMPIESELQDIIAGRKSGHSSPE
jgi:hypothetical protein